MKSTKSLTVFVHIVIFFYAKGKVVCISFAVFILRENNPTFTFPQKFQVTEETEKNIQQAKV